MANPAPANVVMGLRKAISVSLSIMLKLFYYESLNCPRDKNKEKENERT